MAYQTPGVYVREIPAQTQISVQPTVTTAVFLGSALRGPSNPTLITSWSNYTTTFGQLSNFLQMVVVTHMFHVLQTLTQQQQHIHLLEQ